MSPVNDFMADLPADERQIMEILRSIILDTLPGVAERLSYGVPFYYLRRRVCYLWPSSKHGSGAKEGVVLGFCRGNLLSNEDGLLQLADRKEVSNVVFTEVKQIHQQTIENCLLEAAIIDAQ